MEKLKLYLFHRNDRVHRIRKNSNIAVSYFQNRRWRLVTVLEELLGYCPHQSKLKQYPLRLFYLCVSLIAVFAGVNKLREYVGTDTNMTIECSLLLFVYVGVFVKLIFASTYQSSRQKVYERIARHFETLSDPEEDTALNKAAEGGFKYIVNYFGTITVVLTMFDSVPVLLDFYDYLFNHCELKIQLPVPLNFGFDHSKYWYIIALEFIMWDSATLLLEFTYNLSFTMQVRHVTALFKIVGIRLRKSSELTDGFENETMSDDAADQSYFLISSAIDLHSECLEVVKLIEKSYSSSWFVILLLSTASFGAGVHLVSTKIHDPIEIFRFASLLMIVLMHFHMVFSQGQLIIDSAESVCNACCECKWYGLPKKSGKMLSMMMIRTSIPCQLTGAKLFPLSLESFGKMLKAGLSYYTVFRAK